MSAAHRRALDSDDTERTVPNADLPVLPDDLFFLDLTRVAQLNRSTTRNLPTRGPLGLSAPQDDDPGDLTRCTAYDDEETVDGRELHPCVCLRCIEQRLEQTRLAECRDKQVTALRVPVTRARVTRACCAAAAVGFPAGRPHGHPAGSCLSPSFFTTISRKKGR